MPWHQHAVAANVPAAAGEADAHARQYGQALQVAAALKDMEARDILEATLRVIPAPSGGYAGGGACRAAAVKVSPR